MKSREIYERFIKFFENRQHVHIPSAPVVPENDPSSLFTTAGMQPLVPYLLGQTHPAGSRLVNVQKCVRTNDIDEVGDATHLTFFQMLGNWSIGGTETGGYGKAEAIQWSYDFLIDKETGLGLDPNRLYITVFAGNDDAPRDLEASQIWQQAGIPESRIYYLGSDSNWWSPGDNGPCGPNSEMFYDLTKNGLGELSHQEFLQANENQQVVEIWNDVFMEYRKVNGEVVGKLNQPNIDTGAGLERLAVVLQRVETVYDTDLFNWSIELIKEKVDNFNLKGAKIISDHMRCAAIMISDGVIPSNTDQGYVLRRLIRRSFVELDQMMNGSGTGLLGLVAGKAMLNLPEEYKTIVTQKIVEIVTSEEKKFSGTLSAGIREFNKISNSDITGKEAFNLFSTYGFPIEMTIQMARERGVNVDMVGFQEEMIIHQQTSKSGSEQKFKGGLAGDDEMSVKYHTTTHLLHAALREVLGDHVEQRGSNITPDRLRFDFSHDDKLTDDEKQAVEDWVNNKINQALPVTCQIMSKESALDSGAIGLFADKYGDEVSVYTIGGDDNFVSRELCGGPHVQNTSELGIFQIKKEEASSAGVRRIKAILKDNK